MKAAWIDQIDAAEWKRLDRLLDAVLDMKVEDVPAFLDRECAGEPVLRQRLETLLRADRAAARFLSVPVGGWGLDTHDTTTATDDRDPEIELDPARPDRIGRYRVLEELGRGGMGVVFHGREEATGRAVALKMLPASFATDARRVALFLREARLLASLHHPNIATIHGLERSAAGQRFLVLELVAGQTLAARLAKGPLPVPVTLDVAAQLASALSAAHACGIVHRDVKPTNLMLTASGLAKVLDFGIAKHIQPRGVSAAARASLDESEPGLCVGTPGYMSPEQILGGDHQPSSDVFSFGCVIYESLARVPAFASGNRLASLGATLHGEVDFTRIPAETPAEILALLRGCLSRDPAQRPGLAEVAAELAAIPNGRRMRGVTTPRPPRVTGPLPTPLTPFIGREREVEECENALSRSRLVTLTGAGGCGKTRLAIEVARALPSEEHEVIWFADLAPASDDSGIQAALAAAADVRGVGGSEIAEAVYRSLAGRSGVLVLDNCEHVVAAAAALAQQLLERCPRLRILATSREWLGVPGEMMLRVSPLPVPHPDVHFSRDSIAANESVRLFVEHAAAVRPGFGVDEGNAEHVVAVCRALDGIPLAIELTAALLSRCELEQIAADLGPPGTPRRWEGSVDELRHSTLASAIDCSYRRLDEEERRFFEALSIFAGGWSLESAVAVTGGEDAFAVLDRLTRLLDQSLVQVDPTEHLEPRYRFLEPIHAFARHRLAETPQERTLRRRHVEHFVDLAEQLEPRLVSGTDQVVTLRRFEADHQNLLTALRACHGADSPAPASAALRIARSAWRFWYMRGHLAVGRDAIAAALARPDDVPNPSLRAHALAGAGVLTMYQHDDRGARRFYREALALHRSAGDLFGEASTLNHLGAAATQQGNYERARVFFEAARQRFERLREPRWLALMLNNLGAVSRQKGDLVAASEFFDRAIPLARDVRNLDDLGLLLVNSALVGLRLGKVEVARDRIHEAFEVVRDAGAKRVATAALEVASEVLLELGLPEDAARLMGSAHRVRTAIGVPADDGWRRAQQPFLDRLQRCLDPSRYRDLVHEGTLVSFEEVLDHVCRLVEAR